MNDNVLVFPGQPPLPRAVAEATRIGFYDHVQCEHLLSSNKLAARRFVIEAGHAERQNSLLRTLRDAEAEIVLDTNAAELSVPGRFSGAARNAPWAADDRMLEEDDFVPRTNRSVIEPIARFAVEHRLPVVMAPTHYLGDGQEHWLPVDARACAALRVALDREAGRRVAVDYPLICTYAQLRDPAFRQSVLTALVDLPFDHLWLRISGFGMDATGSAVSRVVEAVRAFHVLGRPILMDRIGGLAASAVCAFGAASGFAAGIEGQERFDTAGWVRPKTNGGGGRPKTVYVAGLDRRLKVEELQRLFDDNRTSRSIFGCQDTTCCGSVGVMLGNPTGHLVVQRARSVRALSTTPESARADRFIAGELDTARKAAQRAARLKTMDEETRKKTTKAAKRLDRMQEALEGLHEREGSTSFAEEAPLRSMAPPEASPGRRGAPS